MRKSTLIGSFGRNLPYDWFPFVTKLSMEHREYIGRDFFKRLAAQVRGSVSRGDSVGLCDNFSALSVGGFRAEHVDPLIQDFYEHTSRFGMKLEISWNPLAWIGWWVMRPSARGIGQLNLPLGDEELKDLESWVEVVDIDGDGMADYRAWIRVLKKSKAPMLTGAYRFYHSGTEGEESCYISSALPLKKGSLTVVFALSNLPGGGLQISTRDRRARDAGVYRVRPSNRVFSMMPGGLSEVFRLQASNGKIRVEGVARVLGIPAFKMKYTVTQKDTAAARDSADRFCRALERWCEECEEQQREDAA